MHPEKHLAASRRGQKPTIQPITPRIPLKLRRTPSGNPDFRKMFGRDWRTRYPGLIPEYERLRQKRHRKLNPAQVRAHYVKYGRKPSTKARRHARRLERDYGITATEYAAIERAQGSVCAICGESCKRGRLAVDHCHETNRVRGLLCRPCNVGLGSFLDDPERLKRAIAYLAKPIGPIT